MNYEANLLAFTKFTEEEAKINAIVDAKKDEQSGAFSDLLNKVKGKFKMGG